MIGTSLKHSSFGNEKLTKYVLPEQTLQEHNLVIQQIKAEFIW